MFRKLNYQMPALLHASLLLGSYNIYQNISSYKGFCNKDTNLTRCIQHFPNIFHSRRFHLCVCLFPLKHCQLLLLGFCSIVSSLVSFSIVMMITWFIRLFFFQFGNLLHYIVNAIREELYILSFLLYHQYLETCFSIANIETKEYVSKSEFH